MLLWLDLETTGLDPVHDHVLEVGAILTDDQLHEVARFHRVVYCELELDELDPYIQKMHTKNGLWYEVNSSNNGLKDVDRDLAAFIRDHHAEQCQLAGSSVHFDREFMRHHLPFAFKHLHYRQVDVSTLNETAQRFWPELYAARPPKAEAHRVMADIEESMRVYRYYLAELPYTKVEVAPATPAV